MKKNPNFEVFHFYIEGMIPRERKWEVYFLNKCMLNNEHPTGIYLPVMVEEQVTLEQKAASWNVYNKILNDLHNHQCRSFEAIDYIINNYQSAGFLFWTGKGFVKSHESIKLYMLEHFKISLFDSLPEMNQS